MDTMVSEEFISVLRSYKPGYTPRTICDAGAFDCAQSIELLGEFKSSTSHCFEADPQNHNQCVEASKKCPRITFSPYAVSQRDGQTRFFSVSTNKGAGSIYKPSGLYDEYDKYDGDEITVPSIRLESYIRQKRIEPFDCMWLDAQGGELDIIKSLGVFIGYVVAIWSEFCVAELYSGQPLMKDLCSHLTSSGFSLVHQNNCHPGFWGNACFIRTES